MYSDSSSNNTHTHIHGVTAVSSGWSLTFIFHLTEEDAPHSSHARKSAYPIIAPASSPVRPTGRSVRPASCSAMRSVTHPPPSFFSLSFKKESFHTWNVSLASETDYLFRINLHSSSGWLCVHAALLYSGTKHTPSQDFNPNAWGSLWS